jgi:sugar phosphate isomerase/epimerase
LEDSGFWAASIATAHAAIEPGQTLEEATPELIAFFRRLGDAAARRKVRIGLETGWPNTVDTYLGLIRSIDHEHVGATIDTGHIRSYRSDIGISDDERPTAKGIRRYNDVLLQIVDGLGPKLFHFHFDDVRPADWREHRSLGTGIIDWNRLLSRLSALSYAGAFALELEETDTVAALDQSREYYNSALRRIQ